MFFENDLYCGGIGFSDPRLKAVPRVRFADERELSQRVQNLASFIGTEKFYLTVEKILYKKSAEVGLRPDGIVAKSDAEKISAGKILEEKPSEVHEHDRRVVNPCVAEFISMMSEIDGLQQLRRQISRITYNQAMNEGMTDIDAKEIQKGTDAAVKVVSETEHKIATKRKTALRQMKRKAAKKSPALKAQVASMSNEEFSFFVQNYVQNHDDDLSNEFVNQAILSEIEERAAYQEAADRLEAMSFGDKVKEYVGYIVDELNRPSPEFVEAMSSADPKKIREYAAKKNLKLTSRILDFLVPFDASAVDDHVQGTISATEDAQRQGIAVTETAVAGLLLGKITKAKCVVKFCEKIQSIKRGVITKLAKGINPTIAREARRLDIIKETELVEKAACLPEEWKGQFKLINEIPQIKNGAEFASDVYCRQVLFKAPKTGQMFRVFQRNDIDPNQVITVKGVSETNLQKMGKGYAPYTKNGEQIKIHHMGQDSFGPFVEITDSAHKPFLHNQFGVNKPHPTNPVDRSEFNPIRKVYWRAYAERFK